LSLPRAAVTMLFFDSIHPTSWVHQIIGDRVANEILASSGSARISLTAAPVLTPEPTFGLLTAGVIGAMVFLRWKRSRVGAPGVKIRE
jgi:phospholipase/lecithinase/hemolysin